ncbi:hypothetical protein AMS68_003412 [Peltaster fructicola]|uniref:4-hydroxy-2-oxoglutarate aldolase, mitochondrial n=1 Tax=Peltaster fructicola TaxID=286661 RepID=A0A6H0XTC6_9PEZI|nr:hypothetical protein AMS68_003412 [Peltaster fructicola]
MSARAKVPQAGIWAPALTLYNAENDDIDYPAQSKYFKYLSEHLTGLVVLGTNAETFLLTAGERKKLLHTAREAVGPEYPIIAGVGGHSTKQVLEFINDAIAAKADYALVLPAAYFGKATTKKVIMDFYDEVAVKSRIPILIYNFPGVCNGVDLDSDIIASLAKKHSNIVGVKLTCGSVAKITRLAATFSKDEFAVFGGQSDFLLGGMAVGSIGCIAAFANVFPKTITKVYDLYISGKHAEALGLQQKVALAEQLTKSGIASTKYAAALSSAKSAGIEDTEKRLKPRHPYEAPSDEVKSSIRAAMEEVKAIEDSL